jgi:hypothetical protein
MPLSLRSIALLFAALLPLKAAAFTFKDDRAWSDPSRFGAAVKYTGLSYHPGGGENEEHYLRSLDDKDYWVVLVGAEADADYAVHKWMLVRFSTSLYKDCADLWAGYFHLGFRANFIPTARLRLRVGVGPTYLWRQNWNHRVKGYSKDSFFGEATEDTFQGRFISYGGDMEAEWKAWDHLALVYSVIPGYPEVIQNSVGLRWTF